jgi:hypothetical protein
MTELYLNAVNICCSDAHVVWHVRLLTVQAQLPARALRMMLAGASRGLASLLVALSGTAAAGALRAVVTGG